MVVKFCIFPLVDGDEDVLSTALEVVMETEVIIEPYILGGGCGGGGGIGFNSGVDRDANIPHGDSNPHLDFWSASSRLSERVCYRLSECSVLFRQ